MKQLWLFLITVLVFTSSFLPKAECFDYLPAKVGQHQIVSYSEFTLSYNEEHEQPDWVAYEITKAEALADRDRCDCFEEDQNILTGSATEEGYTSTGFDKGHMSPAAANNISEKANRESFFMSNMSPQLPSFNRGIWAKLESYVRDLAEQYDKVYVVTGPVFVNNLGKIGKNEVTIPGYFYKALLRFDDGKPKVIGFLLPNVGATGEIKDYAVPVNTLETLTGLDFFPDLNDSDENRSEARLDYKPWGL